MGGYVGSRAVNLSTTAADVSGNATIGGNLTVSGTTVTIDSANAQTVDLGDNDKIRLGDGDDLQIYHDGSHSYISDQGTGHLKIFAESFFLNNAGDTEQMIGATVNGAVDLFYDGSKKLETTSSGVDVSGTGSIINAKASSGTAAIGLWEGASSRFFLVTPNGSDGLAFVDGDGSSERMRIDSSGNVGIGLSSSIDRKLHVQVDNDYAVKFGGTASGDFAIEIGQDGSNGSPAFNATAGSMKFKMAGTEAMRIDSSGNVLVGKTTTSFSTAGSRLTPDGGGQFVVSGGACVEMNRLSSEGTLMLFQRDGSTMGSIASRSGTTASFVGYPGSGVGAGVAASTNMIIPSNETGAAQDNRINLGSASTRWKDLYLSGGAYLGGTGSANYLTDYEEGTYTPSLTGATTGTLPIRSAYDKFAYTKVGRLVTVSGKLETNGSHSASGYLKLSLPFQCANLDDIAGTAAGTVFFYRTGENVYNNPTLITMEGSAQALFYQNTAGGDVTTINAQNMDTAIEMYVGFSYMTN